MILFLLPAYSYSATFAWIPPVRGAVYWGPGFVGWVYTPSYVSWVPLAPGDIYYGYGYYGPNSVNIINMRLLQKCLFINIANAHNVCHSRNPVLDTGASVPKAFGIEERFRTSPDRSAASHGASRNDR